MKTRRRLGSTRLAIIFLVLTVGLSAYGLYGAWPRYAATHHHAAPPSSQVVTASTSTPDETPVDPDKISYIVAADMPKIVSLPSLGAKGFIQQVGLDAATRQLAVPTNIHFAGWYTGNVKPGDPGLSVIDGHISGRYDPGLFQNLAQLRPNDRLSVEYGDGRTRTFEVVSVKAYPLQDAMKPLLNHDPLITSQLNLITCGGIYDMSKQTFDKRVIVVTKLIG